MAAGEVSVHPCSKAKSIFSYKADEKSLGDDVLIHFAPQRLERRRGLVEKVFLCGFPPSAA
jgi:hypothetical protein